MRELAVAIQNENEKVSIIETINSINNAGFKNVFVQWYDENLEYSQEEQVKLCKKLGFNIIFAHLGYQNINSIWEEGIDGDNLVERYKKDIKDCKENGIPMIVMHLTSKKKAPIYGEIGLNRIRKIIEYAKELNIKVAFENANKDKKLKTDRYIGIRKLASVIDEKKKERYIKFYHYVREEIIADIKRKRGILKEEIDYIYKKITNSQLEGMSNAQKLYVLDQTRVIENKQDNFYINKPFNVFYRAVPNLDETAEYKTSKDLIDVVKRDSTEIKELYEIKDMNDLIRFELLKFVSSDIEFKECENCHQYFIPVNRKDEIYCNRPIKGTEKTCKDVGAMNRHKEKAGDIPGEKEYWRVYKRYKYKADRKIVSKSEFNQWNYMALEVKQECAEGKITVNDMLQRIEVFENRKKVGKK